MRKTSLRKPWSNLFTSDQVWSFLIFAALFVGVFARQIGIFQFDAQHYWDATRSLVGIGTTPVGFWELRGVFSAVVYLPAAVLSTVLNPAHETLPVLAQNAAVIAAFGAYLLPWVIKEWAVPTIQARVVAAVLLGMTTAHFAPYALVDLYPAFALIATIPLLNRAQWLPLTAAGVLIGVSLNMRPAYAIVGTLLLALALFRHRWLGLFVVAGLAAAIVPQIVLNLIMNGIASPVPIGSGDLAQLQAGYASYTVRYDTMFGDPNARQFYCSPSMAAALDGTAVTSLGGLAWAMIVTLPVSAIFGLQKIGASMFWPLNTPYSTPAPGVDPIVGSLVTVLTVIGIAAILRATLKTPRRANGLELGSFLSLLAIIVGTFVAIVASAAEARFALAAILVAILGVATLAAPAKARAPATFSYLTITATVLVAVFALSITGLAHPAPRGEATIDVCAGLG